LIYNLFRARDVKPSRTSPQAGKALKKLLTPMPDEYTFSIAIQMGK
jgi:hypothetical protein